MKRLISFGVILLLACIVFLAGCQQQGGGTTQKVQIPQAVTQAVQQKAATAVEAIKNSEAIQTVKGKVDYLVGQANSFYDAKKFQPAIDIAQYILGTLDANSSPAQSLLAKAQEGLRAAAQSAMSDVTQKMNTLGQ